jgi:hypothetical protein
VEEPDTGAEEFLTEDFAIGPTAGVVDGDMGPEPNRALSERND